MTERVFDRLDQQGSGFITASQLKDNSSIEPEVFYFMGSVWAQLRHLGAVTRKHYHLLCEQLYKNSQFEDIRTLLKPITKNNFKTQQTQEPHKKRAKTERRQPIKTERGGDDVIEE